MDVISHSLWAGAAAEVLRRRGTFARRDVAVATAFGAMPDVVALLPVSLWASGSTEPWESMVAYVTATPGKEPDLAPWAQVAEHVLHCSAHSVVVLAVFALIAWRFQPALRSAALGWGLHLALDVPTHSESYYAVTLFYPFSEWHIDGIAWTTPAVLGLNWILLAATCATLWFTRERSPRRTHHA